MQLWVRGVYSKALVLTSSYLEYFWFTFKPMCLWNTYAQTSTNWRPIYIRRWPTDLTNDSDHMHTHHCTKFNKILWDHVFSSYTCAIRLHKFEGDRHTVRPTDMCKSTWPTSKRIWQRIIVLAYEQNNFRTQFFEWSYDVNYPSAIYHCM